MLRCNVTIFTSRFDPNANGDAGDNSNDDDADWDVDNDRLID